MPQHQEPGYVLQTRKSDRAEKGSGLASAFAFCFDLVTIVRHRRLLCAVTAALQSDSASTTVRAMPEVLHAQILV